MTRSDIEREYTVIRGQITSPGRFEGEPVFAPYFWDLGLNSSPDRIYANDDIAFDITDKHRQQFPELGDAKAIVLAELKNGDVVTDTN